MTEHEADDTTVYEFIDASTRRLAHLAGIAQDLTTTIINCRLLKARLDDAELDDDIKRSLWLVALIHYGRAFETAAAMGISNDDLMQGLNGDPLGAHRQYLAILERLSKPQEDPFQRVRVGLTMSLEEGRPAGIKGTGVFFMETTPANHEIIDQLEMLSGAVHDQVLDLGKEAEATVLEAADKIPLGDVLNMPQFNPMATHSH
jgi:hypothetical protein